MSLSNAGSRPGGNVTSLTQIVQSDAYSRNLNIDNRLLLKKDLLRILVISFLVIVSQVTLRLTLF